MNWNKAFKTEASFQNIPSISWGATCSLFDLFIEDLRQRFLDDRSLCEEKRWWLFGDDISDGYGNNKKKKKSI